MYLNLLSFCGDPPSRVLTQIFCSGWIYRITRHNPWWIFKMPGKYLIVSDVLSGVWKSVISIPRLFAIRMSCLDSAWHGFLIRCCIIQVIFTNKISCVKKYNGPMVYSEIPLSRKSLWCGAQPLGKRCGLIGWFLYGAPYSMGFLKNLSESVINNLWFKICNSSNTLQFVHIPDQNPMKKL